MKREGLGVEVVPDAAHLNSKFGVARPAIGVRGAEEGNWVVPLLQNQHPYHLLIAVNNEVSSVFVRIFG